MGRIKPIQSDTELSLVGHLEELRSRLIVLATAFLVVAGVCLWQNDRLMEFANGPLPDGFKPATLGVSEAFVSTLTISIYAAAIVLMPLIVYEVYAFVVPALRKDELELARPFIFLAPVLFAAGSAFGYVFVLPAAVNFLLNFNDDQFNVLVRASEYYSFFGMTVLMMGALFELPLAILTAARLGIVTPRQLRENRRYALLAIAVVAMLLPGTDPVSMTIEMLPLIVLYEGSIWLTTLLASRSADATGTEMVDADLTERPGP